MTTTLEPLLLKDRDAAHFIGVSRATLWRGAADGTLPAPVRIVGGTRWRRDELLAVVEAATAARDAAAEEAAIARLTAEQRGQDAAAVAAE